MPAQIQEFTGTNAGFPGRKDSTCKTRGRSSACGLVEEARNIIRKRRSRPAHDDSFIFPVPSEAISPEWKRQLIQQLTQWIHEHMNAIAKELRLIAAVTIYAARHSFSTVLKRKGISTDIIKKALRHHSVVITKNYLTSN